MKRHSDSQFKPSRFRAAIAIICWSLCALSAASGATITVTSTSDSGPGSLRQAIKDAAAGDTINFSVPANGIINLTTNELLIDKSLTITGPGANTLRVQNGANFRVFEIIQPAVNVSISGLSIAHGVADFGGGIVCYSVNLTVASCTISQNSAGFFGGGILFSGDGLLTITNSTIADNFTSGLNSLGGGVGVFAKDGPNDKKAMIINSTISGNHASGSGGGICYSDQTDNPGATLTLANTTVTNNYTQSSDGGGVVNGKSDFPGGVLYVNNSIIAGNTVPAGKTGPDFAGDLTSQGYNIIGDVHGTGFNQAPGDQLGVNPKLDALQDNGGPTPTHALRSGSPAIDAGDSGGAFVDQRGYARPVDGSVPNPSGGDGSDIGAYEVQADQLPGCNNVNHTVNNNDDSGAGSLRDIIANVCNGTTIDFAPNVRGAINLTSGELVINNSLTINGPGANLLSVQRSTAAGTPEFRIFDIVGNRNVAISGLTISNGKVSGNISFAGGILNSGAGTLTLTGSTVSGNSAGFIGGGIANNGTLLLTNSTVSGNVANNGGGISGGTVIAINSTIADNMAQSGDAGGIFVQTVTLTSSTISGNSASGSGGGVFNNGNNGASIRAKNTIIALNNAASGPDVSGALTSENFNLIGNVSGGTI
ncbi:MAG: choice-of-anchor Q domain-containing protein, partial [Chthoniobacterales bacterium]